MGPLGGLAGALRHAGDHGFDLVLTAACDMPDIPPGLVERLGPAPSVVKGQQLVGLWPASLAAVLEVHLDETGGNSGKAWMGRTGARQVDRSEEHTSELQSLMRTSYAVFCLIKETNENHIGVGAAEECRRTLTPH